jgi:hypothetical protein
MKFLVAALAACALGAAATAQTFNITLDGAQEVPPVPTAGTGTGTVTLNVSTGAIQINGTYTGLTSNANAAHLHGPAGPGAIGGIMVGLAVTGGTSGTYFGGGTLTPAQVTNVLNGLTYLNVHTVMFGSGEVRGQVVAPGSATAYGGNPAGSLTLVGGAVKINQTATLGVDNPLGSQTVGSLPFVGIATAQDPLFIAVGTGTPIPGWGMSGPTGELLISVAPPNPLLSLSGAPWTGAGNPAPVALPIPNQVTLVGLKVFAQGILVDPFGPQTLGLTNGLTLDIGL